MDANLVKVILNFLITCVCILNINDHASITFDLHIGIIKKK